MWVWLHRLGSPKTTYRITQLLRPWLAAISMIVLGLGLCWGLAIAPADYQQGDAFRIIYVHVPAAVVAMLAYVVMAFAAFVFLVWKIKVADMAVKVSAPLGAAFTAMTLVAGSIWGKPMWGAWWIWDARLTSELILLFIYLGIMVLRSALPQPQLAARICAVMALIGALNLPVIHYSVTWWHTLHQGATLLQLAKPAIAPSMLYPLLCMLTGAVALYLWLLATRLQAELLMREGRKQWVKQLMMEV